MKKQLSVLTTPLLILGISGISSPAIADWGCCLTPYLGVDAQIRHMEFFKRFGGNVLKKNYPQGNFFAGLKFCDYVGVEFGYSMSQKKSQYKTLRDGDTVFGRVLGTSVPPATLRVDSSAYSSIRGWNMNLMGFLPILCEDNSFNLIGAIGISQLKLKVHHKIKFFTQSDSRSTLITREVALDFNDFNLKKRKYKGTLRLTVGAQQLITDCLGMRGLITWENTARLKSQFKMQNRVLHAKPKNAITYGVGIFTQF